MRFSIVVAAHNEGPLLAQTLQSIYETTTDLEFEVVLVDDGSKDGSVAAARRQFSRTRLVTLPLRNGPAAAKDAGASEARGETLLFLDAHTKPERGAIRKLVERIEDIDGQGIVVPAIPALDAERWQNSRRQVGQGYAIDLQTFQCSWKPTQELRRSSLASGELYESPALIGCAFAISQSLYEKLWRQDMAMAGWGVEDIDLGLKSWLMGFPVLLDPAAVIGHRFRSIFDNYQVHAPQMLANQLRMARKNLTETVWNEWVQLAQQRFSGSSPEIPEGIWTRAWGLFEANRPSAEEERAYLLGRRVRDEFWYADYFGLDWPVLSARQSSPLSLAALTDPAPVLEHQAERRLPQQPAVPSLKLLSEGDSGHVFAPSPPPPPGGTPGPGPGCDAPCGCPPPPGSGASGASGGAPGAPGPGPASGTGASQTAKPVNYLNGQIVLSVTDLASSSFNTPWLQRRTYSNQLDASVDGGLGYNWLVDNWPHLIPQSDGTLVVVRGTVSSLWFDPGEGDSYQVRYGAHSTLVHDSDSQTFLLTSPDGTQQVFHDFVQTEFPGGSFDRQVEPGGLVTAVQSYTEDGFIAELRRTGTLDGQPLTEAFVYSYTEFAQVESLALRRQLGTGGWEEIRRVTYAYWDGTTSFGSAGDLQQVTIQTPTETGWADSQNTVYRYYVAGQANGFVHGLKFVINPATYQRMLAESVDPLSASDGIVATFADNYYEFDGSRRVTLERTDGGAQTLTLEYTPGTTGGSLNDWAMKTLETRNDGSQSLVYTNSLGQTLISDFHSGSDHWLDAYHYDENSYLLWHAFPAAILGYDDSSANLNIQLRADSGLIENFSYYSTTGDGAVARYVAGGSVQQGTAGTPVPQVAYEYASHTANGTTVYPLHKQTIYRDDAGSEPIITTYATDYYSGTVQPQQIITTLPAIPDTQNGDNTAATTRQYFDTAGRMIWSMDERGFIAHTVYDLATGGVIQQTQDVDSSTATGVPSGWTTPTGGGLNLVTDNLVDDQGRTVQSLGPVHQIDLSGTATNIRQASWNVFDDDQHITYSGSGSFVPATSSSTLINPVSITQMDDGGKVLATISAVAPDTSGTLAEILENAGGGMNAFSQSNWVRWQTRQYTQCCLVASQRVYFHIPSSGEGTEGTNYNQSNFGYDSMQRRNHTVTPGGTITDVVFDPRGLVVSTYVGTNDDGATESDPTGGGTDPDNNMVLVTANVYDNGESGGNGNLTQQTQYAAADDTRVTSMTYDFRNRKITTDGEIDYFQKTYYDNLDRVVKVERYDSSASGNLISREETLWNDRNETYRIIRYGVDPATGTVGNALTSNLWYDDSMDVIQSLPAGSKLFTKTTYDGIGRPTASYNGYTPSTETNDPASVAADVIMEQTETIYDAASNVIQTVTKQRYHNAPDTQLGALGDPSTTPKARVTYAANYPDSIGRTQATANYGTNGGTALTRSTTIPARSDTVLVNSQAFDSAGKTFQTTDPITMMTRFGYDDAGRQTSLIENYQVSSSSSNDSDCAASDDTNRTTLLSYTPDSKAASLTAVNSSTTNQVTQYIYGTTLSDSEVASSLLLRKVIYPDSTSGSDVVLYTYNRLAQRTSLSDQNGNVHTYQYDKLGRPLHDRVTTLGSGVDGAVRRFSVEYDVRGLVQMLSSFDNPTVGSGTAVNQVQFTYNDFGQSIQTYQAHSGTVNTSTTPSVGMNYANGADNSIRPTKLVYPNGRELNYSYGTAGDINDLLSRIAALIDDDDTTDLAEYAYLGLNDVIQVNSPEANLQYTLVSLDGEDDPDTGDIYAGLDRFGRISDCRWRNTSTDSDLSRTQYGYDRDSNRIWRKNPTDPNSHYDWLYSYDGLQRLKDAKRGTLNGTHDAIADPQFKQCWSLDATGNWQGFQQADNGTDWTLVQSRTSNSINEITDITDSTGPAWVTPAYDPNGNMTTIPWANKPTQSWSNLTADGWDNLTADGWGALPAAPPQDGSLSATYDAWNRMVKLTDTETSKTVQENQYDARNFRIVRKDFANGTLTENRHFYYTDSWQDVEERLGSSSDPDQQNVWGVRYIDDLILRDRDTTASGTLDERLYACQDANWNVTAVVDTNGDVQERYEYNSYGSTTFLTSTFSPQVNSNFDWITLYCGYCWDQETTLYQVRNRVYSAGLGGWLQRDPAGYADSFNFYEYCQSQSVSFADPYGLGWGSFFAGLASGAVSALAGAAITGTLVGAAAVATVALSPVAGAVIAGAAVGFVAYGAYQYGTTAYQALSGRDAATGRQLSPDELSYNRGAAIGGLASGLAGGRSGFGAGRRFGGINPAGRGIAGPSGAGATNESISGQQSTQQALQGAANRANATVGPGKGPVHGTKVHSAFETEVNAMNNPNLTTEVSYQGGMVVARGTKGSVRADVVEGPIQQPTGIYDLKTGSATLTPGRIQRIQQNVPGGSNCPVQEIR